MKNKNKTILIIRISALGDVANDNTGNIQPGIEQSLDTHKSTDTSFLFEDFH